MTYAHFRTAGVSALFVLLMLLLSMRFTPFSRTHRALEKALRGAALALAISLVPNSGVGLNALSMLCAGALGLPGMGLLAVLAAMR